MNKDLLAVVIGRNRRVYARMYKKENSIARFSRDYFEKERGKSEREGFRPVDMTMERPNETTWVFHIRYEAV